jgi:hypothetical protein
LGIDNVSIDLVNNGSFLQGQSDAQDLASLNKEFLTALDDIRADGVNLQVHLDQQDTLALSQVPGFEFNAADSISLDITAEDAAASGTHLSTSLKDLQKLGVDAVSIVGDLDGNAATVNSISLEVGAMKALAAFDFGSLPSFGDFNLDGNLSVAEDNALNVTLDAQFADIASLSANADALGTHGIDNIALSLSSQSELEALLGNTQALADFNTATLDVGLDFGQGQQIDIEAFSLNADNQDITLNFSNETTGTHLSASLKDLQKLGVDAVSVAAGVDFDGNPDTANSVELALGEGALNLGSDSQDNTLPVFDDILNVTLDVNFNQLGEVAGLAASLQVANIDNIAVQLQTEDQLISLLTGIPSGEGDLYDLNAAGFNLEVGFGEGQQIDLDAFTFDTTTQDITLDVTPETTGTHLSASLKDLQKLGVDAVSVAAGIDNVSIELGVGSFQFNADGTTAALPSFEGDNNLNVTLSTSGLDQAMQAADLANATGVDLQALGIDNISVDLVNNVADNFALQGTDFANALQDLRTEGLSLSVNLDQQDVFALGNLPGFSFDGQDQVTLDITADAASTAGTHLSTSLKDLQKLGIDAVNAVGDLDGNAATVNSISLDLGNGVNFSALPEFGDMNNDGIVSAEEDAALNVTLDVQFDQLLESIGASASTWSIAEANIQALSAAGIDNINVSLQSEDQLIQLLSGTGNLQAIESQLVDTGLGLMVDFGSGQVDFQSLNLEIDGNINTISLDVESASAGTHLSTSLKDLQKLGVDAISVTGNIDAVSLDLGSGGFQTQADGNFVTFQGNTYLDVTLRAAGEQGAVDAAAINAIQPLASMGIDNLDINLANGLNDVASIGQPGTTVDAALIDALKSLEASGLDLSVSLDAKDVLALQQMDFSFAAADQITFDLSPSDATLVAVDGYTGLNGTGTHLSTSLADLQKLGVDAVTGIEALGNNLQVDLGVGFKESGSFVKFDDSADITLRLADNQDLSSISDIAEALKASGIDHISMGWGNLLDEDQAALNALSNVGIDFKMTGADNATQLRLSANTDLDTMLQNALSNGVSFSNNHDMGDLVQALFDSGVASAVTQPSTQNVTISDDLASALYASGLLTALPQAGVEIEAGMVTQMQTTFKAMAEMGVDKVASQLAGNELLQVNLGDATISDLADLLKSFVSEDNETSTKAVFDHAAALDVGATNQAAIDTLQSLLDSGIASQLYDMGVSQVVAQVVPTTVVPLGAYIDGTNMVFDLDILSKKH